MYLYIGHSNVNQINTKRQQLNMKLLNLNVIQRNVSLRMKPANGICR